MRIALDGSLLGARFSGVERSVAQLLHHLPQVAGDQHEFIVFVGNNFDRFAEKYEPGGFDERLQIVRANFDNTNRLGRLWWQQVVLPRLCHGVSADVFHAPAYVASAFSAVPTVVTLYDLVCFTHPLYAHPLNRLHYRLAIPAGVRRAQRVIVPSSATRRSVARYLPLAYERTVRIPLGVEDRFFHGPAADDAAVRESYRLPDEYLLWVGNVEPKKNVPQLLRAMHVLRSRGADVPKLVIAGNLSWGAQSVMKEFLQTGLQSRVMFLGRVRDADLPALYRGASAFLFPSLSEGFGLPPLEAMASGVPVIVSNAGPLPEVAGEAGLVVDATNAEAWADAIVQVLTDGTLRSELIPRGRSRAAEFTWPKTARQTVAVYEAVGVAGLDEYDHSSGRMRFAAD